MANPKKAKHPTAGRPGGGKKRILLDPVAESPQFEPLRPVTVSAVQSLARNRKYFDKQISALVKALSLDPLASKGFGLDPISKVSVSYIRTEMGVKPASRERRSGVKVDAVSRRMAKNLVWSNRYSLREMARIMKGLGRPVSLSTIRLMRRERALESAKNTNSVKEPIFEEVDVLRRIFKGTSPIKRLETLQTLANVRSETIEALNRAKSSHAKAIYGRQLADIESVLKALFPFLSRRVFAENGVRVESL